MDLTLAPKSCVEPLFIDETLLMVPTSFQDEDIYMSSHPAQSDHQTFLLLVNQGDISEAEKLLVEKHLNVNAQDPLGNTALHYAAGSGDGDGVTTLIQHGADKYLVNGEGLTAYQLANAKGATGLLEILS
jgi:ankyrin repeat protein